MELRVKILALVAFVLGLCLYVNIEMFNDEYESSIGINKAEAEGPFNRSRALKIKRYLTVGITNFLGQVSLRTQAVDRDTLVVRSMASQTADLMDIQDSSGNSITTVDDTGGLYINQLDTDLATVSLRVDGANAGARTGDFFWIGDGSTEILSVTSGGQFDVAGAMTVGGAITFSGALSTTEELYINQTDTELTEIPLRVDGANAGDSVRIGNIVLIEDGGTDVFTIDPDGDATFAKTLTVTGATTLDGAVTLGDAAADITTVSGSLKLYDAAADPCGTLERKSLFFNTTDNIVCFCNHFSHDLKLDGTSASCY